MFRAVERVDNRAETAAEAGFSNERSFFRGFKEVTGMIPSQGQVPIGL